MVRADHGELTKLPGIATFSSLVSLGVVHDQQRARRVVEFWVVTHATNVEHPQASRSHLSPNLPAARGRVACRVPREAGLGTAPAFLPHPGQAAGARLRRQVDQAPYCSS